ncbi:coniferyl aldehyde dehydrogenase [Flavisphingopyxis soli]|nr:coniferyl aldehyde dehydrogenase [Sphingorhabdus soli]
MADADPKISADSMQGLLDRQRAAFMADLPVSLDVRHDRLTRAVALLVDHGAALCDAMSEDFGHRSREQSMLTDVNAAINALKHARKHAKTWMKSERRPVQFPLGLLGARATVEYQPKGVVGIIAPWNFPIVLAFSPLAGVFAAGNRAMLKPSEFTPVTSDLIAKLVPDYFDPTELAVVTGGPDVGKAFSELAFDHLIYTGSTNVGRHVMAAAAKNLVPVTLELGGKSPVIVSDSANIAQTAERVVLGKMMNAGQICLAPDYLLVSAAKEGELVDQIKASASALYPTLLDNDDYSSVVNDRHYDRLQGHVDDARAKGAEVIVVNPANEDFASSNKRKMPLHIIRNVRDEMTVMQEEIFGPLLPIKATSGTADAVDYVNAHDRPLGLYYFGSDSDEERRVLDTTISGGVTVNDVIFHVAMEDLPFGGVGPSGIGSYHGIEGFRAVSHAKSIYRQPKLDIAKLAGMKPPYGKTTAKTIARDFKK